MTNAADIILAYHDDPEYQFDLMAIEIGEMIVSRLNDLKLTRKELAERLNVTPARVSQILGGDDNLTLKSLVAVANSLGARLKIDFDLLPADGLAVDLDRPIALDRLDIESESLIALAA